MLLMMLSNNLDENDICENYDYDDDDHQSILGCIPVLLNFLAS